MRVLILIISLYTSYQAWANTLVAAYRSDIRDSVIRKSFNSEKSEPRSNDLVEDLLPHLSIERNIFTLSKNNLSDAHVTTLPWSDDYWPIYKGILGTRYMDSRFSDLYSWQEAHNFVEKYQVSTVIEQGLIDNLSPAEKYDLLISEDENILTQAMWSEGEAYHNRYGEVEHWMGICHGWAPASFIMPRPSNAIKVPSFNNQYQIRFYPSDLKALGSLLWAKGNFYTHFIGGRCEEHNTELDENSRPVKQDCLDNNPASFHLALIHRVGIEGKSFVMDATEDYEVWNQPIMSYKIQYYSLATHEQVSLDKAIIPISSITDGLSKFRSPRTKYLVGVKLEVEYGVETSPTHLLSDSSEQDRSTIAYYTYDLELDENYNIIGGEWYSENHPDFLWLPQKNSLAQSSYDYYLLNQIPWEAKEPLNTNIAILAKKSARKGVPLAYIINSLFNLSNQHKEN